MRSGLIRSPLVFILLTPLALHAYTPKNSWERVFRLNTKEQLQTLDLLPPDSAARASVSEIIILLNALALEHQGDRAGARAAWTQALQQISSFWGRIALEGWVYHSAAENEATANPAQLANELLPASPRGFLRHFNLDGHTALTLEIASILRGPTQTRQPQTKFQHDHFMLKSAQRFCSERSKLDTRWRTWKQNLPTQLQSYWDALVLRSCGPADAAINALSKLAPQLLRSVNDRPYGIIALQNLVQLLRFNDQRVQAAHLYPQLVQAWQLQGQFAPGSGFTEEEFALGRINDSLWASRYQALVGDYEQAEVFAQKAKEFLADATKSRVAKKNATQFADLQAESAYVFSHLIYLENNQFSSAAAIAATGLAIPQLSNEWRERLQWSIGLYHYLADDKPTALQVWTALLQNAISDAMEPKVRFWIRRVTLELGDPGSAAKQLQVLRDKFPLNFYTVVGPTIDNPGAGGASLPIAASSGGDLQNKVESLNIRHPLHEHPIYGPLLVQAETLISLGLQPWAKIATRELYRKMSKALSLRKNKSEFLYLSRLLHQSENYPQSIALTSDLADTFPSLWSEYPEQLLVFYPRAYKQWFTAAADASKVEPELVWSIARQESIFDVNARSYADARGIMQVILPTASRFSHEVGVNPDDLNHTLFIPDVNIMIGSRVLANLSQNYREFTPAVYAAYNAGEYAVDRWMHARPKHDALLWVELIPFGETRNYVFNIWRNVAIYRFLDAASPSTDSAQQLAPKNERARKKQGQTRRGGLM